MQPELTQIPPSIAAVNDYLDFAQQNLTPEIWEYIHSGSADDVTFANNESGFRDIKINSRVLRDLSRGSTHLTLLGEDYLHPIFLGPVAYQKVAHKDGEIASAMAANAQDSVFVLSTLASTTLEDVARCSAGKKWFQLYFLPNREDTLKLVKRAEAANYKALMITVDAPVNGLRNRLHRSGFELPEGVRAVNIDHQQAPPGPGLHTGDSAIFQHLMAHAPTWEDIEWLKQQTGLPLIIKGIMHPGDARIAQQVGASAIVVSNHGGRTLDTSPASIEVLPVIADALQGEIPVLFDGGIRRGSDIFKALALGANAVLLGRPIMYALATAGALGVAHILRVLRDELEVTMALCGCAHISDINRECLWQPQYR